MCVYVYVCPPALARSHSLSLTHMYQFWYVKTRGQFSRVSYRPAQGFQGSNSDRPTWQRYPLSLLLSIWRRAAFQRHNNSVLKRLKNPRKFIRGDFFFSFWIINSVWCSVRQDLLFKVGIMYSSFMLNCPLNDIFVWLSFVGFCFVLCLWDRVSCGPGWTWTLCVMKAGLLLLSLPSEPGASQACATTSGSIEISVRALCSLSSSSPPLYDVPLPVITPAASGDLCS